MTIEAKLMEICKGFIEEHKIQCPEKIYASDKITEESPYLIQQICDTIGYYKGNDNEDF